MNSSIRKVANVLGLINVNFSNSNYDPRFSRDLVHKSFDVETNYTLDYGHSKYCSMFIHDGPSGSNGTTDIGKH